jgi:hypothetical protein
VDGRRHDGARILCASRVTFWRWIGVLLVAIGVTLVFLGKS